MHFRNRIVRLSQLTADKVVGLLFKTAETGIRLEIGPGTGTGPIPFLRWFTGRTDETEFGSIVHQGEPGVRPSLTIQPAQIQGADRPVIEMHSDGDGAGGTLMSLSADVIFFGNTLNNALRGFDFGQVTDNVGGGTSEVTVFHGLGVQPRAVIVAPAGGTQAGRTYAANHATGLTDSQFRVRVKDGGGTDLPNGTSVSFWWLAVA